MDEIGNMGFLKAQLNTKYAALLLFYKLLKIQTQIFSHDQTVDGSHGILLWLSYYDTFFVDEYVI